MLAILVADIVSVGRFTYATSKFRGFALPPTLFAFKDSQVKAHVNIVVLDLRSPFYTTFSDIDILSSGNLGMSRCGCHGGKLHVNRCDYGVDP